MDKYITKLIQKKNRVIIPEFGAFIVKQGHPKSIVFNEFLKYNDGLLVNELKESENLSEQKALQKVEEYVADLNGKLNIGQQHKIEGFGVLKKDASGRIIFKAEDTVASSPATKNPEPAPVPSEPKPTQAKEEESIELDLDKESEKDKDSNKKEETKAKEPEKKEEQKETKPTKAAPEKPAVEKPVPPPAAKKEPVTAKKDTSRSEVVPASSTKKTETKSEKYVYTPQKSNRSRNIVWVAMVLVILSAILVWFIVNREYLFDDDAEQESTAITIKPEEESQAESAGTDAEEPSTTETNAAEQTSSPSAAPGVQPAPAQKKYYIVAGCFQFEKNADEYVNHLRNQGFNAEKFGKYGNLHAVSFNSFNSYNQAVNEMKKIKESTEPDAWILYQ